MADFYNLINARIERSGRSKKDKEKEMEKVDQLFHEENEEHYSHSSTPTPTFSGNLDLDSFIIGEEEIKSKNSSNNDERTDKYLSQELGKEFEDKDFFKEINEFDFLSLEKMPIKNQNRVLRNEYLEIRGKLSEFNDEMNQKNRKLRSYSVESEQLKKQHKMMKDTIRFIASMLPDGSDLKHKLDTNNWKIEDIKDALAESLDFVTNRVRNADQYVQNQLSGMEETVAKYKKVLAMELNEKNLLSQEVDTKNATINELSQTIKNLEAKLFDMDAKLKNTLSQKKEEPKETEEERMRREKIELLRKKEQELLELKMQLEGTSHHSSVDSVIDSNIDSTVQPNNQVEIEIESQKQEEIITDSKPSDHKNDDVYEIDKLIEDSYENNHNHISDETKQENSFDPINDDSFENEDVNEEEFHPEEDDYVDDEEIEYEEEEESPTFDPDDDDFDIDAILEKKLKIKNNDHQNSDKKDDNNKTNDTYSNQAKESQRDDIVIPTNIDDHIRVLNDKRIFVIRVIGDNGFARNQEIADFIEKDTEGIRVFSSKGKFQKQEVTNTTRGLADSEYLSSQKVEMGGRNGHNFKVYELTNMGKAIYKHLFNKIPVIPESQLVVKQHASLEHGYLIKETVFEFENMGYKVYTDRKDCRYDLPNGDHKVFDLVIEKDGKKQMIEVERGTHTDKDFFKAMNKVYEITKDFYFVCPSDSVMYDKTRRQWYLWMKKDMGGANDPRIKELVSLNLTTLAMLKKEPKPKTVWKTTKF